MVLLLLSNSRITIQIMKTNYFKILSVFFFAFLAISVVSNTATAQSKKKIVGKKQKTPFCCKRKYKTNKKYFRSVGNGESKTENSSKMKALLNARKELAAQLEVTMKSVTDQYINEVTVGDESEFQSKFEDLTKQTIDETLLGVKQFDIRIGTIKKKIDKKKVVYWKTYVAIEMHRKKFEEAMKKKMLSEKFKDLNINMEKFQKKFDKEMEKQEKENYENFSE